MATSSHIYINHDNIITIKQACRATSAAPTYLPPMKIADRDDKEITFWDGGLLNNNPVDQVWDARYDLPEARMTNAKGEAVEYIEPVVSCVVSIGASYYPPVIAKGDGNLVDILFRTIDFATNTDAKHWDFMGNNIRRNARLPDGTKPKDPNEPNGAKEPNQQTKYFRYNAKASKDINLDDYQQMGVLVKDTKDYLKYFEKNFGGKGGEMDEELRNHIDECARELAKREKVPKGDA